MLAATDAIVVSAIGAFSAIVVAGIAAWSAIQVSRATTTQSTTVVELKQQLADANARIKELEKG